MFRSIVLLEDDWQQMSTFAAELRARYSDATVHCLRTESTFYDYIDSIEHGEAQLPDLVIADVMLPWAEPSPNATRPVPKEIADQGCLRAGLRCLRQFRTQFELPVPWVLFTVLEPKGIEQEVQTFPQGTKTAVLSKEEAASQWFEAIERLA